MALPDLDGMIRQFELDRAACVLESFARLQEAVTSAHDYAMDEADRDEHRRVVASILAAAKRTREGRSPLDIFATPADRILHRPTDLTFLDDEGGFLLNVVEAGDDE